MPSLILALVACTSCGSTGELVDPLRDLPKIDRVAYVEDRPTVRVVPCDLGADLLELFSSSGSGAGSEVCSSAVERALASSGAFRVRGDSDAVYDLRLESMELSGGGVASVRILGLLWDTAEDQQVGPGIDVLGEERKGDLRKASNVLELAELFQDRAPVHRVNAVQKALWKLTAQAQNQLR